MTEVQFTELMRRLVRIETRLVILLEKAGYDVNGDKVTEKSPCPAKKGKHHDK